MSALLRIVTTARGAEQVIDTHGYKYYFNRQSTSTKYWLCSQAGCKVRLMTHLATNTLVGDSLPDHDHGNNLNKRQAIEAQQDTVKRFASLPTTTAKMALSDITNSLSSSSNPDALFGMSSSDAIKAALWREKNKQSHRPALPKTFRDLMKAEMLPEYTKTADGGEFLILRSWLNSEEKECLMVFLSDTGADILRRADTWLLDGTFRACPSPFYQASESKKNLDFINF
jgi:hypothetical protein